MAWTPSAAPPVDAKNTQHVHMRSVDKIETLHIDNGYILLTWFPDPWFKKKLTKLSFLKLSERKKKASNCIQSLHLCLRTHICLCKAETCETEESFMKHTENQRCKQFKWQKNIMRTLNGDSSGLFCLLLTMMPVITALCHQDRLMDSTHLWKEASLK